MAATFLTTSLIVRALTENYSNILLTCSEDNQNYLRQDPNLVKLLVAFTKEKLKNNSIIISQNLVRDFADKLANENVRLEIKIRNSLLIVSENLIRLIIRVILSAAIPIPVA